MSRYFIASIALGFVALAYFLAERSLSFFSWSMFEELSVPRPRRLATEKCLAERELVSVSFLVWGGTALAAAAACVYPTLSERSDPWLVAVQIAGAALLITWLLPELIAWYAKSRVVLYLIPPLYHITGMPFRIVRRAFGVPTSEADSENGVAEGEAAADAGTVDGEAREFLRMAVRLKHMPVREVMTPRTDMVGIRETTTLKAACELSRESGYSRLPVYRGNRDTIIGVLHIKDLLAFADTDRWSKDTVADLVRSPLFIPETKAISELMDEFQRSNMHMGIVLDEYGGTAGLVTLEDVVEELIGEIRDEHEAAEQEGPLFQWINEKSVEIQAVMHIEEMNEEFDLDLPEEEDFDTLGGYVLFMLGKIPSDGESFESQDVRFTVAEADPRRVIRVRVDFKDRPRPKEKT